MPCTARLPNISHGSAVGLLPHNNQTFRYTDTVIYKCDEGYVLYRGEVTCQSDGTWSADPRCIHAEDLFGNIIIILE